MFMILNLWEHEILMRVQNKANINTFYLPLNQLMLEQKNSKQMPFLVPCSDLRSLAAFSSDRWYFSPIRWSDPKPDPFRVCARPSNGVALGLDKRKDPRWSICTADELHYVSVPNSDWNLALWRYLPSPKVHSLSLSMFIDVYCEFLGNNGD